MKAIVTGSSGFVGSYLARKLLQLNWTVVGIDNHSNYYSEDLKLRRLNELVPLDKFIFENVDICNSDKIRQIVMKFRPDFIFHLAAQAGVRLPISQLKRYVDSNLDGFSSMLQVAVTEKVPNFLYASSSSVYGNKALIPYRETEQNLLPSSFYGATKLANEILAQSLIKQSETKARGLRLFTVYGPNGRPDMAYFRIISNILNRQKFEMYGDGTIQRDFTYIEDCVEMIYALGHELNSRENGFHDVVNIGGGHPVSMSELVELSCKILKSNLSIEKLDKNIGDVERTMADTNYLFQLIGKIPMTRIGEGLQQTINWANKLPDKEQLILWTNSTL